MKNYEDNYQKLLGGLGSGRAPEGLYKAVVLRVATVENAKVK